MFSIHVCYCIKVSIFFFSNDNLYFSVMESVLCFLLIIDGSQRILIDLNILGLYHFSYSKTSLIIMFNIIILGHIIIFYSVETLRLICTCTLSITYFQPS